MRVLAAEGQAVDMSGFARPYRVGYTTRVLEIRETDEYIGWFEHLRDLNAQMRIGARIRRVSLGNFGDVKSVGDGVSELRIPYGPGYRVYFVRDGDTVVILLAGGDKSSQKRDIARARELAIRLREGESR
jgi:putative addiction module killer protein